MVLARIVNQEEQLLIAIHLMKIANVMIVMIIKHLMMMVNVYLLTTVKQEMKMEYNVRYVMMITNYLKID